MKKITFLFVLVNIFSNISFGARGCESEALIAAKKANPETNPKLVGYFGENGKPQDSRYYNPRSGRFTKRDAGGYRFRFKTPKFYCFDYYDVSTKKTLSSKCQILKIDVIEDYCVSSPI